MMKFKTGVTKLLLLFLALAVVGCNTQQTATADTSAADQAALLQADKDWAATMVNGQFDAFYATFLDDASVLAPNAPIVNGKDAIHTMVEGLRAMPGFSIKWMPTTAVVSGNMGYTIGTDEMTMNDAKGKPMVERGKYLTIWKKQADGSWKVAIDMFNSSEPPPMPAAPAKK